MKIFTSYFARIGIIKNPISICAKAPNWFKGPQYKVLAPKYSFFKDYKDGKINSKEYTEQYINQVLFSLSVNEVLKSLESFYPNAEEVTLLCYEKPEDFCHRHIVAEWLTKNGFETKEKNYDK